MRSLLIIITVSMLLTSCVKDHQLSYDCNHGADLSMRIMNLDQLVKGQKFRFLLFIGEVYDSETNNDFTYTEDTLEVEVLQAENGAYLISEKITAGSQMRRSDTPYYWGDPDKVYINTWRVRNDSLFVGAGPSLWTSHLLFNHQFSLSEFQAVEIEVRGWKTSYPYTESDVELYTNNFSLFCWDYDRLNVFINNSAMRVDLPGNTTFYNRENGIIRTSIYSWWTSEGIGWDRL